VSTRRGVVVAVAVVALVLVAAAVWIGTRDEDPSPDAPASSSPGPSIVDDTTASSTTGAGTVTERPRPGRAGVGDTYYPELGNGGYDVAHYTVGIAWNPEDGTIEGRTSIDATATAPPVIVDVQTNTPRLASRTSRGDRGAARVARS